MTEVAAAGAPALAQNAIIHVIDFADDAIARNDATRKAEAFRLVKVLIKSAAAGTISLDAAKCDHVERLVQTLHLSALAAEVDEEAKAASRLEMEQLRATIQSMKASTPSTAAAPTVAASHTELAATAPGAVASPPSEVPVAAPASLTAAAASSPGQRKGKWTTEEEAYARKIVAQYKRGDLPASFAGRTLNQILQKELNCNMLRVSKKMKKLGGDGSMKTYVVKASQSELEAAATELATLEAAYIASLPAPKPPKAPKEPKPDFEELLRENTTPFASGDAALVAAVAAAEPIARGNDATAQAAAFESLSCAVLVADPAQVRLDAAASRLLLSVAEVLFQKVRKAANTKKPGDSLSKNIVKLRGKIAQLGPQAPGAVEAANQRLVAALDKAKLALDAADDATKAKAYDALRKAVTEALYKASLDVKTHDELLRVGMELLAAKNYKSVQSSSSIKSKLESDIKALCPDAPNAKPAPRQRRDRDDAPIIPEAAFLPNAFDDRAAAVAASQANGSAPTNQRAAAGSAVQEADEAQRREQLRSDERWRAVAGSGDKRSPEQQVEACAEMRETVLGPVREAVARRPEHSYILYIGSAVGRRIFYSNGSIADEPLGWLGRNECVVVSAETGELLSAAQIRHLIDVGALKVFASTPDPCGPLVDVAERETQVAGRLYAAQAVAEIILGYGLTTPGGVGRMRELCGLFATLISLDLAAAAGVRLRAVEVSPLTTVRGLAVEAAPPSFLDRPRGNVQAALRTALDALRSSGSGSGDVDKTCLSRPPGYLSTRVTWSSWAAVRVGHFGFLFWFVEGGQVYVKRSNFCEGGELAAKAYYRRVCRAKLNGLKWRVPVPCFPGLEVDGVLGGGDVEGPVDVDVDDVDKFLEDDEDLSLMEDAEVAALVDADMAAPSQLVDDVAQQRPRTRSQAGSLPSTAAAPAEVEAAPDADDDRTRMELEEAWAAAPPEDVVFDELAVTEEANNMSEAALREALAHASRESRGEKPALVARFVDLQRSLAAREVIPVDDFAPLVETPEEAPRTPVGKRRRRLQPSVAAPLPPGWAFGAGLDVDLKLSDIAGTTTSLAQSALLETTVPAAASGLVSLGPVAAVPSPGWGSFAA